MIKFFRLAFLVAIMVCGSALFAQEAVTPIPPGAQSPARVARLQELLRAQAQRLGGRASAEQLAQGVREAFLASEAVFAQCGETPCISEVETLKKVEERLWADAQEKYPNYSHDELVAHSQELFPLYRKGQRVTIRIRTNPKKTERIEGFYNGTHGGRIALGKTYYNLSDMTGIPGNDGPEGEIAKFDPVANGKYRTQWQSEYARESAIGRAKFIEENQEAYALRQHAEDFLENERLGYTFYLEKWLSPEELVQECASALADRLRRRNYEENRENLDRQMEEVESQGRMTAYGALVSPDSNYPSANEMLRQRNLAERRRQEQISQREKQAELLAQREREEARQEKNRLQREQERQEREAQRLQAEEEEEGSSFTLYIVVAVVIILVVLAIFWGINYRKNAEEVDVSKFYEGKGKLQKDFWDAAAADPDHFKYVAYLFPDAESARDALLHLSYLQEDAEGNIVSKRDDLRYGCYEHQNGAVAFVGSTTLNYARWREASMTWPELPYANYFKVSSEPQVSMLTPDMDKLKEMGLHVENLGVEDMRMKNGEINRVYRFRAADKNEAITLLETFDIKEEGVVVRVQTAEGVFGKDVHGVFAA